MTLLDWIVPRKASEWGRLTVEPLTPGEVLRAMIAAADCSVFVDGVEMPPDGTVTLCAGQHEISWRLDLTFGESTE